MRREKPNCWQIWIVYSLVALLVTVGSYVGGYFLFGEHSILPATPPMVFHQRFFESKVAQKVFGPLGYAEAKIRGEPVFVTGLDGLELYEP